MFITRARLATKYIFVEMLPSLLGGVITFTFILLMFQALRLAEFVLVHDVSLFVVLKITFFMTLSFLPATLPMSLLFAVLLTYSRLSDDSEITAMKSLGLSLWNLTLPAVLMSGLMAFVSAETSFEIGPWGHGQFNALFTKLASGNISLSMKQGTFSDGFSDFVVYANEIDDRTSVMKQVFIYDERAENQPVTIIAEIGRILSTAVRDKSATMLHLQNGSIHRNQLGVYTKVDFKTYDIVIPPSTDIEDVESSPKTMTLRDLRHALRKATPEVKRTLTTELHKRWALAATCFIFGLLGVGLGTRTNKRAGKSYGVVISLALIVIYWVGYVMSESLALSGFIPPWLAIWMLPTFFLIFAAHTLKKAW